MNALATHHREDKPMTRTYQSQIPAIGATAEIKARLEELRTILRSESISMGELMELQDLADQIEPDDVELLEAAGVPEFDEDEHTHTLTGDDLSPAFRAKYPNAKSATILCNEAH